MPHPHPFAHREGGGGGSDSRAGSGRGRLPAQAVCHGGTAGPGAGNASAQGGVCSGYPDLRGHFPEPPELRIERKRADCHTAEAGIPHAGGAHAEPEALSFLRGLACEGLGI